VLTRDPLKFVFRIDTVDAQPAQFSPDSQQVVFFSSGLRVETWSIDRQEQTSVADVPAMRGCRQTALSPDAKYFACFGNALDLTLFDVGTGETIFKKEHFFDFDAGFSGYFGLFKFIYLLTHRNVATLRFSPDAHYSLRLPAPRKKSPLTWPQKNDQSSWRASFLDGVRFHFCWSGSDRWD